MSHSPTFDEMIEALNIDIENAEYIDITNKFEK